MCCSALEKTEIMLDHVDIVLPMRHNGFVDYCQTLFSSIVILVDVVVTHNNRACLKALELDAIGVLKQYLDIESMLQVNWFCGFNRYSLTLKIVLICTELHSFLTGAENLYY